ncbi:MAG: Rossmann-fold NAD(P)-binding domain-containing protein [Acidimicrobiales bacterium]
MGRHVVEALVVQGEDVTLVHRGRTNPDLFPQVEHRPADRTESLTVLGSGRWDATIDVCACFPRQVRPLHENLGDRGGAYVHISSASAYAYSGPGRDRP